MIQQRLLPHDSSRWNSGLVATIVSTVANGYREDTRPEIARDVRGIDKPAMAHGGKGAAQKQARCGKNQTDAGNGSVSAGSGE